MDSQDVCRALNISKRALQNYRSRGIIPHSMLGGKIYFREADIVELLRAAKSSPGNNSQKLIRK
jgi:DNA-binding transcriptional MerR regulator